MKIYIISPSFTAYFAFIDRLYKFKFISNVSKENQVLILYPEQLRGLHKALIFLLDGAERHNPKYKEIEKELNLRRNRNTVIGCSPMILQSDFTKLILAATS